MKNKHQPYAILVFGEPLSGKTTFAKQFSERYNLPFLNFEQLHKEHGLSYKLANVIVGEIAKSGANLIIEGLLNTEKQRTAMRQAFIQAGYKPVLVWVQTDINTIHTRAKKVYRNLTDAKASFEKIYSKIEVPSDAESPLVISGKHTFQTQCRGVLRELSERQKQ